jgi:hypothetical protein
MAQNGTKRHILAQKGTKWHILAQLGPTWHISAQKSTKWHISAQSGTFRHKRAQTGTKRHKVAQSGPKWHILAQTGTNCNSPHKQTGQPPTMQPDNSNTSRRAPTDRDSSWCQSVRILPIGPKVPKWDHQSTDSRNSTD